MKRAFVVFVFTFLILGSSFGYIYWEESKPASANSLAQLSECGKKAAAEIIATNQMVTGAQFKDIEDICNAPSVSAQDQAAALNKGKN